MKLFLTSTLLTALIGLAMAALANPITTPRTAPEAAATGAQLYAQQCVKCHGKDGRAKGIKAKLSGARNLAEADWQERVTDERIFNVISNGKGRMPAFGKKLSEAEVDLLVQHVRSLKK